MRRYAWRDDQWERIKDFLPGRVGHVGGTAADNRLFVEAVFVSLSSRGALAGSARALWRLEKRASALEPVGRKWCLEEGFPALGRRGGQRVRDD
jgi:hypothetical protein